MTRCACGAENYGAQCACGLIWVPCSVPAYCENNVGIWHTPGGCGPELLDEGKTCRGAYGKWEFYCWPREGDITHSLKHMFGIWPDEGCRGEFRFVEAA